MTVSEVVRLDGHVVDSLILAKVLDMIVDAGATYRILDMEVGRTATDQTHVRLEVTASEPPALNALLGVLHVHGVYRHEEVDAEMLPADMDGVLPTGFYSTTNLPTWVRVGGSWIPVSAPEMDCAVVVGMSEGADVVARTVPMHQVHAGDRVVVGWQGMRVERPERPGEGEEFGFMGSEVSSEKPKGLMVDQVADSFRRASERRVEGLGAMANDLQGSSTSGIGAVERGRVLLVCGPAVVHTGAAPAVARLVRDGWVQVLFAGNGFATHDIESSVLGTSLGIPLAGGVPGEHGHSNHLRIINEVRRYGSIEAAVEAGWLTSGVFYECVRHNVPFVLGGSVRDDGPLPDVITDTLAAADAMRLQVPGVEVALMLASTLHAIATGNVLPSGVETFCVDINQAVVTKLADRGSHQAVGIVTDVGLFVTELADRLCGPEA